MNIRTVVAGAIVASLVGLGIAASSSGGTPSQFDSGSIAAVTTDANGYSPPVQLPFSNVASVNVELLWPAYGQADLPYQHAVVLLSSGAFKVRWVTTAGKLYVGRLSYDYVATATQGAPPPTTTAATTTAPPPVCAPITITAGGTYSGCYQSSATGTPAVTIATAQPVTLDHATVNAKGYGVTDSVAGVQLSVFDSVFTQQDPGVANDHRAIALYHGEASADIEHNSFTNTDGIWLAANTSAGVTLASVKVDYNVATNIGRYPHETANFGCCVAFFQLSQVRSAVIEAAWNKVTNVYGQSSEDGDNINFWNSGGTDTTHKADIRNNLIDGAYPPGGTNDTQFTGGGINVGDANDHNANVHNNTVVSTTNYGVSGVSAAGVVDTHIYDNLLVNDGAEQASAFGNAQEMWNPSGSISATCTATGNSYNWHRSTTDATQYPCYQSANCTGSVLVSTTEQQARDAWESSRIAAGVTIGPQ